jgi:hypothetical protein
MGRYAFFNTGLEYKFTFGVQPSRHILDFGGTFIGEGEGYYIHTWSQNDSSALLDQLRGLEDLLGLPEVEFEKFSKDLNGTYSIVNAIWEYLDLDSEEHCRYQLGCLIYHQLLYEANLRADFEV